VANVLLNGIAHLYAVLCPIGHNAFVIFIFECCWVRSSHIKGQQPKVPILVICTGGVPPLPRMNNELHWFVVGQIVELDRFEFIPRRHGGATLRRRRTAVVLLVATVFAADVL